MKSSLLPVILFSLSLFACSQSSESVRSSDHDQDSGISQTPDGGADQSADTSLPTGDNSMNALDWEGTYFATLPCASCEGIETWVTLNQDGTFELKTNYLGLNDAREETFTGNFTWDSTGSLVTLHGLIGDAPGKYKVGENRIWHLDRDGQVITGDLADRYILHKSQ